MKNIKHKYTNKNAVIEKMNTMKWYHKIDLGNGIITPGRAYEKMWESTSCVMNKINYEEKAVLDLGSLDGYWAFEAEKRGASKIVSTDARFEGYENLLFARSVLNSNVIPLCNVPVQDLENRLNIVGFDHKFDIVQHFGLLYHLRDPMLSLSQARKVLSDDGILILETAFIEDDENSYMAFSGLDDNFHFYGISDTWAPSKLCLREMLIRSCLEPIQEDDWSVTNQGKISFCGNMLNLSRITMIAKALPPEKAHMIDHRKIFGTQ